MSRPELGPVLPERGFDAATDRASGAVVAWMQATPLGTALVAGCFDRAPGSCSRSRLPGAASRRSRG